MSREFESKKKMVTKRGQFKKKTQKQKKEAQVKSKINFQEGDDRWTRTTSTHPGGRQ